MQNYQNPQDNLNSSWVNQKRKLKIETLEVKKMEYLDFTTRLLNFELYGPAGGKPLRLLFGNHRGSISRFRREITGIFDLSGDQILYLYFFLSLSRFGGFWALSLSWRVDGSKGREKVL